MNLENAKADLANLVAFYEGRLPALSGLKWYYGFFGKHFLGEEGSLDHSPEEQNYCGTTACAGGIMALAPGSGYEIEWTPQGLSKELSFYWPKDEVNGRNASAVAAKWGLSEWDDTQEFYFELRAILLRMDQVRTGGEVPIEVVIGALTKLVENMEQANVRV